MTTRRDLIKLTSALGLAGTLPTTAERVAALQILDQKGPSEILLNPGVFANEASLTLGYNAREFDEKWVAAITPEEWAEYTQACNQLSNVLERHGIPWQEAGDFESAATALLLASYDAGIRHGAAFENLRRSVVGEITGCPACIYTGLAKDGASCGICGGTGTVAMNG